MAIWVHYLHDRGMNLAASFACRSVFGFTQASPGNGKVSSETNTPSLDEVIEKLLDQSPLDKYVKCVVDFPTPPGTPPKLALLHVRYQEDVPNVTALADFLSNQAVNYALSRRRREAYKAQLLASDNGDLSLAGDISKVVRKVFIDFRKKNPTRASEVGEVLAYCVAIHHLSAAQLISKMSLKTSSNMPIYGLDGIHASVKNGVLNVYFLESKLAGTAASGTADFAKSVAGFNSDKDQIFHEYGLVSDLGNLDSLNATDKEILMQYLDVFENPNANRRERTIGVVCYSEKKHFSNKTPVDDEGDIEKHEAHFGELYKGDFDRHHLNIANQLSAQEIVAGKCMLFLVAVPDVNELRERFYESLGVAPNPADSPIACETGDGDDTNE